MRHGKLTNVVRPTQERWLEVWRGDQMRQLSIESHQESDQGDRSLVGRSMIKLNPGCNVDDIKVNQGGR